MGLLLLLRFSFIYGLFSSSLPVYSHQEEEYLGRLVLDRTQPGGFTNHIYVHRDRLGSPDQAGRLQDVLWSEGGRLMNEIHKLRTSVVYFL